MRLNLFLLFYVLYALFIFNNNLHGQCDVSISSWDAVSGDIVIDVINTTVSHIVLGLHVEGYDYNWGCTNAVNHPGWVFKAWSLFGNGELESGESWVANIYEPALSNECWAEILSNDTLCTEIVVWQVNLSRTASVEEGGWAVNGGGGLQTQNYPDVNLSNNTAVNCALPACDTVYVDVEVIEYLSDTIWIDNDIYYYETIYENIYITDTLWLTDYIYLPGDTVVSLDTTIVVEYIYEVDTLIEYVQLPPDTVQVTEYVDIIEYIYDTIILIETDTLVEYEYIYLTDTLYVETVVYEYIYVYNTDTITEFVSESVYIDCATGEECGQIFPCDEASIFAPNAVTPNGDGWNDTWKVIADGACWDQWEVRIYNRWGGLVWISASSIDEWDADVATGTYVYTITAHSSVNAGVFQFNGTVTVLY